MKKLYTLSIFICFVVIVKANPNPWTQKANFTGTARSAAASFSIGTKGYIGTGYDASGTNLQDFWETANLFFKNLVTI